MENIIYLLCVEKERLTSGSHYHPVVNSEDVSNIDLIACNDLISLQKENRDLILDLQYNCESVIFIPVSLEIYNELRTELRENINKAQEALNSACEALKKAYELMGRELSTEDAVSETTKNLLSRSSSAGKCLDENLNIVNCDPSYKENYLEDFLDEEDLYDDDYYDDDDDDDDF